MNFVLKSFVSPTVLVQCFVQSKRPGVCMCWWWSGSRLCHCSITVILSWRHLIIGFPPSEAEALRSQLVLIFFLEFQNQGRLTLLIREEKKKSRYHTWTAIVTERSLLPCIPLKVNLESFKSHLFSYKYPSSPHHLFFFLLEYQQK